MSFILDALKKSENERQRHIGPSLADVQVRRRQSDRPWWAVLVAALLVINLGVLAVVLTRDNGVPAGPAAPVVQAAPVAEAPMMQPQPSVAAQQPAANPAVRSLADEAGAFNPGATEGAPWPNHSASIGPDLAIASAVPEGPPIVRPIDAPAVAPASGAVFESQSTQGDEILPTHGSLIASGTNLPELHLDIHVHSTNPDDSFVFVNMRKYVEGEALREGPRIEKITPGGVILNQGGLRFLLPRT